MNITFGFLEGLFLGRLYLILLLTVLTAILLQQAAIALLKITCPARQGLMLALVNSEGGTFVADVLRGYQLTVMTFVLNLL